MDKRLMTLYTIKLLKMRPENRRFDFDAIIGSRHSMDTRAFNLLIRKSSDYVKIMPRFDAAVREMRADGTMKRFYNRYIK